MSFRVFIFALVAVASFQREKLVACFVEPPHPPLVLPK